VTCRCRTKEEHAQRAVDAANQSARYAEQQAALRIKELEARTPNIDEYTVEDVEQVGRHLVLKVRYPGCAGCDFDRCKVMVYLGVDLKSVVRWRRIDPHFKAPTGPARTTQELRSAPSPAARFPASSEGWADAIEYARRKGGVA
jgi:hypothetical protein